MHQRSASPTPAGRPAGPQGYSRFLRTASKLQPQALFQVDHVSTLEVALTIDDGPSALTGEILNLLRRHDCRATFFLHSRPLETSASARALVSRMLAGAHEIANHMPEDRASILLSPESFAASFQRSHESLAALGQTPRFFRAVRGFYQTRKMLPVLRQFAYYERFIMASYLPWDLALTLPRAYARQLEAGAFPGAIFVLHDSCDGDRVRAERTLQTLSTLLPRLRAKGYRLEPLGHLLAQAH